MVTVLDFLAELILSAIQLGIIFVTRVMVLDPLAAISWLVGTILIAFSVLFVGYLVAGAVADLFGGVIPSPGRTPPQRE